MVKILKFQYCLRYEDTTSFPNLLSIFLCHHILFSFRSICQIRLSCIISFVLMCYAYIHYVLCVLSCFGFVHFYSVCSILSLRVALRHHQTTELKSRLLRQVFFQITPNFCQGQLKWQKRINKWRKKINMKNNIKENHTQEHYAHTEAPGQIVVLMVCLKILQTIPQQEICAIPVAELQNTRTVRLVICRATCNWDRYRWFQWPVR